MKKVGELIRRPPITAHPSDTLIDDIEKMARYEVGASVVVNPSEGGKPVAVISERDVVKALAMKMPLSTPVEAFMSTRLISIRPDETNKRIDDVMKNLSTRIDEVTKWLSTRIDETNKRIDQTNQRIDDAVNILSTRIDEVAKSLSARIDETNRRIDEISRSLSARIDETNKRIDDLARSLSARIDETNKRIGDLAERIDAVQAALLEIQKLLLELVKTRQSAP